MADQTAAGRSMEGSQAAKPLHGHVLQGAEQHLQAATAPHTATTTPPSAARSTHTSVMHHHDPHAPLESDPPRHGLHDGTMYAQGATGEPYEEAAPSHGGIGERIKEALPGTKEHKAKKESEGNLAVYM